jgi:hypothetical protein
MNPANPILSADGAFVTHQYETLRANALGAINRACNLTLFLRHGMGVWLRTLGQPGSDQRAIDSEPSWGAGVTEAEQPGAALAAILTDVILDQARVAGDCGANR